MYISRKLSNVSTFTYKYIYIYVDLNFMELLQNVWKRIARNFVDKQQ